MKYAYYHGQKIKKYHAFKVGSGLTSLCGSVNRSQIATLPIINPRDQAKCVRCKTLNPDELR